MERPTLTEKHYTVPTTPIEAVHLSVHIEEESTLDLWGDVKGVWDGYKTDEGGFCYIVKPEDDRPEVHDAIYNKIKAILEERMASYYEDLISLPEKAREVAMGQGMEAANAVNWITTFIAEGGTPEGEDFDEALTAFFKDKMERLQEDGLVAFEAPQLLVRGEMDAAEWDAAQRLACLVRFAEAGGPKNPRDWRAEIARHVNSEVVADLETREDAAPRP